MNIFPLYPFMLCGLLASVMSPAVFAADRTASAAVRQPLVVTEDIARFWRAYDQIQVAQSREEKAVILRREYVTPGSPGLHAMMERRRYSVDSYLDAIERYPRFWASIRGNTLKAGAHAEQIEQGLHRLQRIYPNAKPATVYFTMGALMSGGTTLDDKVLIGAEISMADRTAVTAELPEPLAGNLRRHFDTDPVSHLVLLNVHEYVHTQQGAFGADLLSVALQEGVAEFVSTLAMEVPSASPAISFGQANLQRVRERFAAEMFSPNWDDWLYNDTENEFGVRDLGYYVGYAIAEAYYRRSEDKTAAIARLIEIDYRDAAAVDALVDASGYFPASMASLRDTYRASMPKVVDVVGLHDGNGTAVSGVRQITLRFSAPMNPRYRGFEYGPLGEAQVLSIERVIGWSEDRTELQLEVRLAPGKQQQVMLSPGFRAAAGPALSPYLIDITVP